MKAAVTAILVVAGATALSLALTSGDPGTRPTVDPRLEWAVNEWQRDLDLAGVDYSRPWSRLESIEVQSRGGQIAGHAVGHRQVYIDPRVLELGPESVRGAVYHELGHAVFRLAHGDGIMGPTIRSDAEYAYNWKEWRMAYLDRCRENLYQAY
jgi:hypothetical protein